MPGGRGYCCYFFLLHYLGTILKFPQGLHTKSSVPGVMANIAEQRQGVCRSHFRVQFLSWPLHFLHCLLCSGALDWGPEQGAGV